MSAPAIPARPTTYKTIKMRSRLEARVAAGLDDIRCSWTYEPQVYASREGQYLPDFHVAGVYQWNSYVAPPSSTTVNVEVRPTFKRCEDEQAQRERRIYFDNFESATVAEPLLYLVDTEPLFGPLYLSATRFTMAALVRDTDIYGKRGLPCLLTGFFATTFIGGAEYPRAKR